MVNAPADLFPGAMVACELQRNPSTRRLTEPVVNVLYQVACVGVSVGGSARDYSEEVRDRGSAEGSTGEAIRMPPRLRPEATDTTLTGTAKQMYRPKLRGAAPIARISATNTNEVS